METFTDSSTLTTNENAFLFSMSVKNNSKIYEEIYTQNIVASDLPNHVKLSYKNQYLFMIKPSQTFDVIMYATKQTALKNILFTAVCQNVKMMRDFEISGYKNNPLLTDKQNDKINQSDIDNIDLNLFLNRNPDIKNYMPFVDNPRTFYFSFESIGQYQPMEILTYALNKLKPIFEKNDNDLKYEELDNLEK